MGSNRPQVLCIGGIRHARDKWQALGEHADLLEAPLDMTREQFISLCSTDYKNITAIYRTNFTTNTGRFDQELVSHLPQTLRFIGHNGAGYDNVDPPALLERKILLGNVSGAVDAPTADIAFWLMLGALRNLGSASALAREGRWRGERGEWALGHDPEGKTLGILGMGGIGRALAKRAAAFDMRVIYHNRNKLPEGEAADAQYVSFDDLLSQSDVLSLNLPLNPSTRHIISTDELAKCKRGVVIVNTARGPVLDEEAVVAALGSGQVGNVGLDVFEREPEIHLELLKNPRTLILPHCGTSSHESMYNMEAFTLQNLQTALTNGTMPNLIPQLAPLKDIYKHN
ncbi:glyoxylate reductase [Savitreella phatthalungensis]